MELSEARSRNRPAPRSRPGGDDDLLFRNERTQVRRTRRADGTRVVVKAAIGSGATGRIRHESVTLLSQATGQDAEDMADVLLGPLEDGLLIPVTGRTAAHTDDDGPVEVRFRHDRVQQAAHQRLTDDGRRELHRELGQRLARAGLDVVAAGQYLAADLAPAAEEADHVVRLYRTAADRERAANNRTMVEQYVAAARRIRAAEQRAHDDPELIALETAHHGALFLLGRLEEADDVYESLRSRCVDPLGVVEAAGLQIASLTRRNQPQAGVALGLALLATLGVVYPEDDAATQVARGLTGVVEWSRALSLDTALARPPIDDPRIIAIASLVNRISAPAFFAVPLVSAWLVVEAARLWEDHGPNAELIPALAHATVACAAVLDAYRPGDVVTRHVLAVGEAHHWEWAVAEARFLHAVSSGHWFEPLDAVLDQARTAREECLHLGDLPTASMASFPCVVLTFETAATLDEVIAEADASITLSAQTGNLLSLTCFTVLRNFCRAAAGPRPGTTDDATDGGDPAQIEGMAAAVPLVAEYLHLFRAIEAGLRSDHEAMAAHAPEAYRLAQGLPGLIFGQLTALPYGIHLGNRLRATDPSDPIRAQVLSELDDVLARVRARAQDQPENLLHMVRLLEAERAWALGDHEVARRAFDASLVGLRQTPRPWQLALVARRAAEFHTDQGAEHTARLHRVLTRHVLVDWGAAGLVAELDRAHPSLNAGLSLTGGQLRATAYASSSSGRGLTSDAIDMLSVLRAAEALASQTTLSRLHATLVDQLRAITGATTVHLVVRDDHSGSWRVAGATGPGSVPTGHPASEPASSPVSGPVAIDDRAIERLVPASAVRYTLRTGRPVLVDDAVRDDRFARDPYFADVERCALLVVPVARAGQLRALLLLENRLTSGAFTADRLDAVVMLTGQLTTALENARLYASLESRIAARTEELRAANTQLEQLAITDSLTGVANRRHFDERLQSEWDRALRAGRPIGLVMIDIDHFKAYNDHFGHPAGDSCLIDVTRSIADSIRGSDLLCRYGGEEFAVILPGADLSSAAAVAERVRAAVPAIGRSHTPEIGQVTVSVGVSSLTPAADVRHTLLVDCADGALYEAKRAGRNQVATRTADQHLQGKP
jgi:diguanylate cyclase (GGDEF)-like protein